MACGVLLGLYINACNNGAVCLLNLQVSYFGWMGDLFMRLLKMIVVPLIFCALVNGISHMNVGQLGKIGIVTLFTFKGNMLIAAVIGLFFVNAIKPGVGFDVTKFTQGMAPSELSNTVSHAKESASKSPDLITQLIPSNIFESLAEGNLIQVIIFAIVLGIALTMLGESCAGITAGFSQFFKVLLKITGWVMLVAPFGVFGLLVKTIGVAGSAPFFFLGKYILTVVLGLGTMLFVVTPLLVWFLGGLNPITFFQGIKEAMITAFSTSSSAATLPVSLECVTKNLKLPSALTNFVVTTGATMSMNGAALYESVVTLFLAQAYLGSVPGLDLSLGGQIYIVAIVLLSTFGTPGIPHGGLITTTIVLNAVGLPLDALGLILGVDRLLDMARTMTNVTGDCAAAVIVNRFCKPDKAEA